MAWVRVYDTCKSLLDFMIDSGQTSQRPGARNQACFYMFGLAPGGGPPEGGPSPSAPVLSSKKKRMIGEDDGQPLVVTFLDSVISRGNY